MLRCAVVAALLVAYTSGQELVAWIPSGGPECPESWRRFQDSCYFMGQDYPGGSYYETAAFCRSLGKMADGKDAAYLAEINSMDEYMFLQAAVKNTTYAIGPWIGMIRPNHNTNTFQLPSTLRETGDQQFNHFMETLGQGTFKVGDNCVGFDRNGNGFGYWNCSLAGTPLCEMKLSSVPAAVPAPVATPTTENVNTSETVQLREGCPQLPGWTRLGKNCYFLASDFPSVNYFQALAFCQGFGRNAHLAEVKTANEKDAIIANVLSGQHSDAPFGWARAWVGLLRAPQLSKKYMLPASLRSLDATDPAFHQSVRDAAEGVVSPVISGDKCGQLSMGTYQPGLGFADCKDDTAFPLCEICLD